jgi:multisubunit Na+/H+ antiporter MnhG subunit
MGIGVGVFLLALGAVLAFAVHASVSGLDLSTVGWILMAAGLLGLVLDLAVFAPRRRTVVSRGTVAAGYPGTERVVATESREVL